MILVFIFLRAQPPDYNDNNNSSLVYYIFSDIIIMAALSTYIWLHLYTVIVHVHHLCQKLILVPIHVPFNY